MNFPTALERTPASTQVPLRWRDRFVEVEVEWVGAEDAPGPVLLFLHEGLGSVAMWKDFPQQLSIALGLRGLVYSRPAYGRSTSRAADEVWGLDFMHRQAYEVLPALREALGLTNPVILVGHSDGGSIALLHAARHPQTVAAAVLMAPHVFVEPVTVRSIAEAAEAYKSGNLRDKLARYHSDLDSAFGGWSAIWLNPAFLDWNIEQEARLLQCPVFAIQGVDDEYGTLEQIRSIARAAPHTELLELTACGHSPHRDQLEQVIAGIEKFIYSMRQT